MHIAEIAIIARVRVRHTVGQAHARVVNVCHQMDTVMRVLPQEYGVTTV